MAVIAFCISFLVTTYLLLKLNEWYQDRKCNKKILFVLLMFLMLVVSANADTVYNGSLTNTTGVVATGGWNGPNGFKIAWDINQVGNMFHYEYNITNATGGNLSKNMSHVLF